MNIEVFTNEQIIGFCFMLDSEIDAKILEFTTELVNLQRKVLNGAAYSEHANSKIISGIDTLHKCKDAKNKFLDELLNGIKRK